MREIDVIESELRLITAIRTTAVKAGMPMPTIALVDQLLDEWLVPAIVRQAVRGLRISS
jgi:hypothetical protein